MVTERHIELTGTVVNFGFQLRFAVWQRKCPWHKFKLSDDYSKGEGRKTNELESRLEGDLSFALWLSSVIRPAHLTGDEHTQPDCSSYWFA